MLMNAIASSKPSKSQLSLWVLVWFYATALICTWDATFIMLRPYTMPGGSLAWGWYVYKYYIVVDQRYKDTGDAYVFAQSLLNYVEVAINIVTVVMHYQGSRHTITAAFTVSVMTMWKTVLYLLMFTEFCTGGAYRTGNSATEEFLLVLLPNVVWIIVPVAVILELWGQLTPGYQGQSEELYSEGYRPEVNGSCSASNGKGFSIAKSYQNGNEMEPKYYHENGCLHQRHTGTTKVANGNGHTDKTEVL